MAKSKPWLYRYLHSLALPPKIGNHCFAEIVHFVVNFWKHRDEWPKKRNEMRGVQKKTCLYLEGLGVYPFGTAPYVNNDSRFRMVIPEVFGLIATGTPSRHGIEYKMQILMDCILEWQKSMTYAGQTEKAIAQLRRAVEIDETLSYVYERLADIYREDGNEHRAEAELRQALRTAELSARGEPNSSDSWRDVERIARKLGLYDRAREAASRIESARMDESYGGDHNLVIAGPDSPV